MNRNRERSLLSNPVLLVLALACLTIASSVQARTLTWDPNAQGSGSTGGANFWDTTSTRWWDGTADVTWDPSTDNADTALFTGSSAYNVTLSSTVYANGLQSTVTTGPIRIYGTGGKSIVLNGPTPTIVGGTGNFELWVPIAGSNGVRINGGSAVIFAAASTYTGTTTYSSGSLRLGINNGLSTQSDLLFTGGSIFWTEGYSQSLTGLNAANSGATIRNRTASTSTITITGTATSTYAGGFTDAATTKVAMSVTNSGTLVFTGSDKTYKGNTTIDGGGTIMLARNGTTGGIGTSLTGGGAVNINAGTLSSDVSAVAARASALTVSGVMTIANGGLLRLSAATTGAAAITGGTTLNLAAASGNALQLNGGQLGFTLGGIYGSDQIVGLSGATFDLESGTIDLTLGANFLYTNQYTLLTGFSASSISLLDGSDVIGFDTSSYDAVLTLSGGNLVLSFTTVPEPSFYALFLSGGLILILGRRLRRIA